MALRHPLETLSFLLLFYTGTTTQYFMCPTNPTQCLKECMVTRGVPGYCGGFLNSRCYCGDSEAPDQLPSTEGQYNNEEVPLATQQAAEKLIPVAVHFVGGDEAVDAAMEELLALDAYRDDDVEERPNKIGNYDPL
ncbi:unnamed protein product [Ixodes pacificus]